MPTILAAFPEFPSIGESLAFQLNGLVVVLMALTSIWGVLEVIGLYFKRRDRAAVAARAQAVKAAPAAIPAAPAPVEPVPPLTLVLIAAAVHATLGRHARVHAVLPAESSVYWAQEGRRQIFASHKVR
ncbi:MAG TPA: hypothetical protein VGD81_11305 [Opitutaceae bacterium]